MTHRDFHQCPYFPLHPNMATWEGAFVRYHFVFTQQHRQPPIGEMPNRVRDMKDSVCYQLKFRSTFIRHGRRAVKSFLVLRSRLLEPRTFWWQWVLFGIILNVRSVHGVPAPRQGMEIGNQMFEPAVVVLHNSLSPILRL